MEYIVLYRGGSKQWASHVNPTLPYLCQFIFSLPSIPSPSSPPPHPQKLHIHPAGKSLLQPFFYRVKGWCSEKRNGGGEKRAAFEQRINKTSLKSERDFADWLTWHSEEEEAEGAREKNTKQERRERYKREGSTSLWLSHSAFMFPTGSHFSSAAPGSTDDLILMFHLASAVIHVGFFFFFQALKSVRPLEADGAATMADYYTSICFRRGVILDARPIQSVSAQTQADSGEHRCATSLTHHWWL